MGRYLGLIIAIVGCGKVNGNPVTVDARGDAPPGTAALDVSITGGGTVASEPTGISCGADCTEVQEPMARQRSR